MNPIIFRFTIGKSNQYGYHSLKISLKFLQQKFGDSAKYVVLYNNNVLNELKSLNLSCELVNQDKFAFEIPYRYPRNINPAFKLYPPRLDIEAYEILLDNDVIIYQPNIFEEFLSSKNKIWITEAPVRSYSGIFSEKIKKGFHINTGLICLPPKYDFTQKVKDAMLSYPSGWTNFLDEQSLIAYILQNENNLEIIKLEKIFVCRDEYKFGTCGMHFVSVNRGFNKYIKKFYSHYKNL